MNIEIANRLINLRKEKGFTQESLADALGISRQAVSKWERAEASPDTDNLICLAQLYGVSLDELLKTDQTVDDLKNENIESEKEKKAKKTINQTDDGIFIQDEDGSTVKIDGNGINIVDGNGETVHVGLNGIRINGKSVFHQHKENSRVRDAIYAITSGLITITYILLGAFLDLWHPAWILFLLIPVIPSIYTAIAKRKLSEFIFPVFITAIYLFLGSVYQLWHPYWVLFITIPAFYSIAGVIDKKENKVNIDIDTEENDDKDDD